MRELRLPCVLSFELLPATRCSPQHGGARDQRGYPDNRKSEEGRSACVGQALVRDGASEDIRLQALLEALHYQLVVSVAVTVLAAKGSVLVPDHAQEGLAHERAIPVGLVVGRRLIGRRRLALWGRPGTTVIEVLAGLPVVVGVQSVGVAWVTIELRLGFLLGREVGAV